MAAMRSYLASSKVSRPPTHRNDVQARYESQPPRSPLQSVQCDTFDDFMPWPPDDVDLLLPPSLLWGDGDSGYSGSPEVEEERRSQLLLSSKIDANTPESLAQNILAHALLGLRRPVEDMRSDRLHVNKQEPPKYTNTITPCQEASTLQSSLSRYNRPENVNASSAGHPRKASFKASSGRERSQGDPRIDQTRNASIKGKSSEALIDGTVPAREGLIQDTTPNDMIKQPSTTLRNQSDEGSDTHDTGKVGVLQWVDATRNASSFSSLTPPVIPRAGTSNRSSPAAPVQALSPRASPASSSRALVLEFWSMLQDRDQDYDAYESSPADESIEWFTDDIHSLRTSTNGSGSNGSPNSSATSNSTPIGVISKTALSTNKRGLEEEGDENGCPNKRPTREQGVSVPDAIQDSSYPGQMSCPMLELHDCQGTNTTISELMRSLMNRHRIVICKECCTRLHIPDEEKRPVTILQKHASDGCERYCISNICANSAADPTVLHRRTERCPSWATLTKEARWTFIWRLVNPESNPPEPNFLPGPAFEHSQIRRPCKQQARARGNEICAQLMRDIEAKERRISTLENDLITAKDENIQTEQRCNKKTVNLENIIESLLERLCENGIGLPGSLRKRLQNECPEAMAAIFVKESQTVSTLPTSTLTPNHAYYPGSGVSSTWGNMSCPPPTMPTMPVTWDAVPQQMVGSNPGYYFPDFNDKPSTTSAMYSSNAYIPVSSSINMSPSAMHAQVGRYSSSETPEIVQPCE